jgi:flagellar biosynthesis protein FlhG
MASPIDNPSESLEAPRKSPAPAARRRQVIALGGGRGGVGRTLLSVNLAVYFAQLGRNVLLVDADPSGSNLHSMLGLDQPPLALPEQIREGEAEPVTTSVPGLTLFPVAYDRLAVVPRRAHRKAQWMRPIDRLEAVDYVVLHLGPSITPPSLDVFHEADVSIAVTSPEPAAIEATYRFCRALFARRLKRTLMRDPFRMRVVERAIAALAPLPTPRAIVAEIARYDEQVANVAAGVLSSLHPGLVVGKARLKRDYELGPAMASLSERYLGLGLDYMGYVEQDDAVWLTARRRRPLLIDAPTSKAARNIERVARRLLAWMAQPHKTREDEVLDAQRLNAPMTLYKVLGVDRSATDDEIRRAFKLQREIFQDESLPVVSLVDGRRLREEQARIHEAYDTLLDPQRRRAYDLSVFPKDDRAGQDEARRRPTATDAELLSLQAELAREISTETQFTGALLRKAREAQGVEIQDIAAITKISPMHLRAIEAEDAAALPAPVYVRGFLQQIAKALKLDPTQVTRTYLKRVRSMRPEFD